MVELNVDNTECSEHTEGGIINNNKSYESTTTTIAFNFDDTDQPNQTEVKKNTQEVKTIKDI